MTRKRMGNYLSISRVKGLGFFVEAPHTAAELGQKMWPGHKMALVNARAIVRDLLLGEYIHVLSGSDGTALYGATPKSAGIMKNPPWLCQYCSLDVTESTKRLWPYPCVNCIEQHQVCRFCKRHLLRATGDFPYAIKVRGCPGTVQVPRRPERAKKEKSVEVQKELAT